MDRTPGDVPVAFDALDAPADPGRVAVVGAGAVGLTAAYDLAVAGADVTLYDRAAPGSGSTGRAAGICYDAVAADVDVAVAARALARFRALDAAGALSFHERPYVFFARDADDASAIEGGVERMRAHGRDVALCDPATISDRFGLRVDATAAALARDAGWVDPADYVEVMLERARAAGVRLRTGEAVAVETDPPSVVAGEREAFDAVLVAAGVHTPALLAAAGHPVPIVAYRAQVLVADAAFDGPMWFDASTDAYARPHPRGVLAGDGTRPVAADPDEWDADADAWFEAETCDRLRAVIGVDPRVVDSWAGLCAATADGDPLVGELADGLYVAAGWQGHGFMRAPATGEAAAATMLGVDVPAAASLACGVDPFDPRRFDGDESVQLQLAVPGEE